MRMGLVRTKPSSQGNFMHATMRVAPVRTPPQRASCILRCVPHLIVRITSIVHNYMRVTPSAHLLQHALLLCAHNSAHYPPRAYPSACTHHFSPPMLVSSNYLISSQNPFLIKFDYRKFCSTATKSDRPMNRRENHRPLVATVTITPPRLLVL